jgi:hypothetical protein
MEVTLLVGDGLFKSTNTDTNKFDAKNIPASRRREQMFMSVY